MKNPGPQARQHRARLKLLPALVLGALAVAAQAAQPSLPDAEQWVATATRAQDTGRAVHVAAMRDGDQVHVAVSLKLRNKTELDALTERLARDHAAQPLTSAQFLERFAPTEAQARKVADYLTKQGFTNVEVAPNRLIITADAGAGVIRRAFKAEMHEYDVDGRRAYANVTDAQVPAHLGDTVLAVVGLQTVHLAHTFAKRIDTVGTDAITKAVTPVSMTNFPGIYGASSLPSASSATIGIITQGTVAQTITDLKAFASRSGYPVPPVTTTVVGTPSGDTSGIDEWNMDTQSSLAAAGGTIHSMILYNINSLSDANLTAGFNRAVSDNLAKVINVSIGGCESGFSGTEQTDDQIFQTAVAQGQTFSISSGDSGAYECGASGGKAQSYPAVSPYVMALGGTTLSSSGATWVGETAWSCTSPSSCQQTANGGAGGGPSLTENAPSWQIAAGVLGSSTKRGVPDISLDAAPSSGAQVLINGSNTPIGGTSLAAPLFAGFWARIQAAHGNTLPFPAATIYQGAAANPSWFHDVTSGNQGYAAGPGWDYATGYGSIQVANLSAGFGSGGGSGPVANFSFTTSGLTATFTDTSTDTGGTINSYAWNFGDGSSSTTKSPVHTYAASGTYTVSETVTDTAGKSNSKSSSVTVSSGGGGQVERLTNGGLEGTSGWTLGTGVSCTNDSCSGETAHGGTGFAWLDGYGSTHTDTVSQTITVTSTASAGTLSFWLHIDTAETTGNTAYDKLTVQLYQGSTLVATLATYSNLDKAAGYTQRSFDISSYVAANKGKALTLKFTGSEDSSLQTSFVLDDVSLKTN